MTEHEKAKAWREKQKLSRKQLSLLTGYSYQAIHWFEQGQTPPLRNAKGGNPEDRDFKPWVWQRYKMACAGVDRKKKFEW